MPRLTETVHQILTERLKPGDLAVDATAGNGHDTLFLAQTVRPSGWVYAFDLQQTAIETTRQRLESAGLANVVLSQFDHANMADSIPEEHHGQIAAIVFNLGYLPGSDKTYITQKASTCAAIVTGLKLLGIGGVMTVLAYTGHPGGLEEAQAVEELLQSLSIEEFTTEIQKPERLQSPWLFIVTRRKTGVD